MAFRCVEFPNSGVSGPKYSTLRVSGEGERDTLWFSEIQHGKHSVVLSRPQVEELHKRLGEWLGADAPPTPLWRDC